MATVRIHIDDEPIDVEAGTNLLIALLDAGHALPHPCFHPALSAPASCRLCLVALEGPDSTRLITACNRNVDDGQRGGREREDTWSEFVVDLLALTRVAADQDRS